MNIYLLLIMSTILVNSFTYAEAPKANTFFIVRHGQTDWNKEKRKQGQTNTLLNDAGKVEALKLAEKFQNTSFQYCYSSPLQRAFDTASIAVEGRSLKIKTDKRLLERNYGHWEGRLTCEYDLAGPNDKLDVETDENIQKRIFDFLNETNKLHSGSNVLVATHAGVMRNLFACIRDLDVPIEDIEISTAAFLQLNCCNGVWRIEVNEGIMEPSFQNA